MPKYIELSEDESWAIDLMVRHTYAESGSVIGQGLLLKVMNLILEFEDRRGTPTSPVALPMAVTEEECWALDHQVRCDLTINNKNVGRGLLVKVFRTLTAFANERDATSGVAWLDDLTARLPGNDGGDPRDGHDGLGPSGRPGGGNRLDGSHDSPGDSDDGASPPLPRSK
ncbi:MAG: hypothetical protein NTV35_14280 [Chloroflexi bacterium]|nr:hypothetical protein [Chloroflexota bacterium]